VPRGAEHLEAPCRDTTRRRTLGMAEDNRSPRFERRYVVNSSWQYTTYRATLSPWFVLLFTWTSTTRDFEALK
jgi:hypothetical protein